MPVTVKIPNTSCATRRGAVTAKVEGATVGEALDAL